MISLRRHMDEAKDLCLTCGVTGLLFLVLALGAFSCTQCSQAGDIVILVTLFLALDISKLIAQVR